MTDGTHSHEQNSLNGHSVDILWAFNEHILQGWSIDEGNDICVFHQRMGRGVVVSEDVLEGVGS